jgi:hypothetical protein
VFIMFVVFFVFILFLCHKSREFVKIGPHPRGHPTSLPLFWCDQHWCYGEHFIQLRERCVCFFYPLKFFIWLFHECVEWESLSPNRAMTRLNFATRPARCWVLLVFHY